jgi:hypothetical protein
MFRSINELTAICFAFLALAVCCPPAGAQELRLGQYTAMADWTVPAFNAAAGGKAKLFIKIKRIDRNGNVDADLSGPAMMTGTAKMTGTWRDGKLKLRGELSLLAQLSYTCNFKATLEEGKKLKGAYKLHSQTILGPQLVQEGSFVTDRFTSPADDPDED